MKPSTDLFLMGVTLAWGPCFASCTPLVLTYLAGTQRNWVKGLVNVISFCIARIIAYIIVAGIAFLIGHKIIREWYEIGYGKFLYYAAGVVTIIFGIIILLGKRENSNFCFKFIHRTQNRITNIWGVILLGIAVGIAPCIPLFGVINYITFEAKNLLQAVIYATCFGAGTFLTPLIPLGVTVSAFPSFLKKNKILILFSYLCGTMLIYLGIKLLLLNHF